jgi:hypothetical protein
MREEVSSSRTQAVNDIDFMVCADNRLRNLEEHFAGW